jgi:dihydroflavonol-4-reductase
MKVFLTGGTGFIGKHLTQALLQRGWDVTALTRKQDSRGAQMINNMGAKILKGDITQKESMRAGMYNADIVIHAAADYELGVNKAQKQKLHLINVTGTENVLSLAKELNIPRIVHVAGVVAIGGSGGQARDETYTRQTTFQSVYEETKTKGYQIARSYQQEGSPVIIVHPLPVVGVNDHSTFGYVLRMYINRVMPPIAWSPETIFCCVEVQDVAEGIALAAEKGRLGESYFFGGEPQSLRDIFNFWGEKPGAFVPKLWLPVGIAKPLFGLLEPLQRMLGLPAFLSRETVRTVATEMFYTSEKAKRELGWTHRSASKMWNETIEGEIQLLTDVRKGQTLIERIKPI